MNIEKIEKNGTICAVVRSDGIVITDAQSALDLLMTAKYELGTKNIVIDKKRIKEDFFILSSGLAGDILQKNDKLRRANWRLWQLFALHQQATA